MMFFCLIRPFFDLISRKKLADLLRRLLNLQGICEKGNSLNYV